MKAVQAHETGGPEVLKYDEIPEPSPGPGEALIAIEAIGVNYTDVSSRKGTNPPPSLPWTPGREGAGVVKAIGANVTEVSVGDRVAYAMHTGSYAEFAAVPSWLLVPLPPSMKFSDGAATMLQAMTAHFLTFGITQLTTGDPVLVHAGAGGVGLLLIQMLKRIGCDIFSTVSTDAKAELAKEAGADSVIIYTHNDFEDEIKRITHGNGLKMVFDAVGRTTFSKGISCLRPRGYMALYGQASGSVPEFDTNALRTGSKFLTRPSLGDYTSTREELLYRANEVIEWVSSGELQIRVGLTLGLSEAVEAHRQLEGRETTGKILLMP